MRLKLISCEALYREMCAAAARSPHQVDVEFVPKGLHDAGRGPMRERLQELADATDPARYDAIVLGYGLCGNGLEGLAARSLPLVVPRAHDCIALLMGGRERYQTYFESAPGVYFRSTGWLERGRESDELPMPARDASGAGQTLEDLIAKYGEDNGRYLFEQFTAYQRSYRRLTYIATGLEPDGRFERRALEEAASRGWKFESVQGSLRLFEKLAGGDWDEDEFLTVPPGWRIKAVYDGRVIDKEPIP